MVAIKNFFLSFRNTAIVNLIRYSSQLCTGILIARFLSVDDKGLHFIFTTLASAVAILLSLGVINSLVYHLKKELINKLEALKIYIFCIFLIGVFLTIIGLLYKENLDQFLLNERELQGLSLSWLFIFYAIVALNNYFLNSLLLAFRDMKNYFLISGLSPFIIFILSLFALFIYDSNILLLITIFIAVETLFGILGLVIIFRKKLAEPKEGVHKKIILDYAIKNYLGISGSTLNTQSDSLIVSSFLSQENLGIYSVAKTLFRLISLITQTSNSIIFGIFCELKKIDAIKLAKKIIIYFSILSIFIFILSFLFWDEVIIFVYGDAFKNAYFSGVILALGAVFLLSSSPLHPLFLSQNRPLISSEIVLYSATLNILLSLALVPNFGLVGAAISVLSASIFTACLRVIKIKYIN